MAANTKLPVKSVLKIRFMKFSFTGQKDTSRGIPKRLYKHLLSLPDVTQKLRRISMGKCTTRRTEHEEAAFTPSQNLPPSCWPGPSPPPRPEGTSPAESLSAAH